MPLIAAARIKRALDPPERVIGHRAKDGLHLLEREEPQLQVRLAPPRLRLLEVQHRILGDPPPLLRSGHHRRQQPKVVSPGLRSQSLLSQVPVERGDHRLRDPVRAPVAEERNEVRVDHRPVATRRRAFEAGTGLDRKVSVRDLDKVAPVIA
ncbi:MAG: hypothetical protein ABI355_02300 [Solirubrobacteraceae bacterium]